MRGSRRIPGFVGALLLAGVVAACEPVPYTGRSQLQLTSPAQESEMGAQAFQQTLAKAKLSSNAQASRWSPGSGAGSPPSRA